MNLKQVICSYRRVKKSNTFTKDKALFTLSHNYMKRSHNCEIRILFLVKVTSAAVANSISNIKQSFFHAVVVLLS